MDCFWMNATNLVDSVASNGREAELLDEFLPDVLDVALAGTDLQGLLLGSLKVLLLTNIGHEADDLVALILSNVSGPQTNGLWWWGRATHEKVAEDAAGIETAGVGEADFLLNHCECVCDVMCVDGKERGSEQPNGSTIGAGRKTGGDTHRPSDIDKAA